MAQPPLVNEGLLVIEASQSHSDTPRSVGLLWTSDQPDTETSKRQTSKPVVGFEPVIPATYRSQTHVLDHVATGFDTM
jgi:hypothetical protein